MAELAALPPGPVGEPSPLRRYWHVLLIGGAGAATLAALIVGNGSVVLALAPMALVVGLLAMTHLPLRHSATALVVLSLSIDLTEDASGQWHSPLAIVGDLLRDNLDRVAHVPGVKLSGLEVLLLVLLVVWVYRRATGVRLDTAGQVQTAAVLRDFVLLYLAGLAFAWIHGLARGQGVAIWKLRALVHLPLLFFLFVAAFRGPADHLLLGRIVIVSASIKAAMAVYVQKVIAGPLTGGSFACATSHGDSILFAVAVFLLIAQVLERTDLRRLGEAAVFTPLLLWGIKANERRVAWVMLGLSLLVAYLLSSWRPWKRRVTQAAILSIPLVALYVGVGWNRGGRIFAPVQLVRGLTDASVNSSTRWRDVENWNIAISMRERPVLGMGLGGEYTETRRNDDISSAYKEYREWPHNTVLGQLMLAGLFGFLALWMPLPVTIFLAVRSYRRAVLPVDRVAALGCIAAVISCVVMAYGDNGAHFTQYRIFAALALTVAGKLAVATGAWPARLRRAGR